MWFKQSKLIVVITIASLALTILFYQNSKINSLQAELKAATLENLAIQANLNECVARVDLQNQKVKQLMLDNETLASRQDKIKERVITKFKHIKVPVRDDACEVRLNFYENLFKTLQNQEEKDE